MDAELINAVRRNRTGDVSRLLLGGADPNARNHGLETPLMYAAGNGNVNIMAMLLDRGANLEDEDGSGSTALFWAAVAGSADALQFLIEEGANIDAQDIDEFGAIDWARASWGRNGRNGSGLGAIQVLILALHAASTGGSGLSLDAFSGEDLSYIYDHSDEDVRQVIENSGREYGVEPEIEDF